MRGWFGYWGIRVSFRLHGFRTGRDAGSGARGTTPGGGDELTARTFGDAATRTLGRNRAFARDEGAERHPDMARQGADDEEQTWPAVPSRSSDASPWPR